jgi:hypothetical protein
VLGPRERLDSRPARSRRRAVRGADFRFDPPVFEPFELPAVSVIGTGKRVGRRL